MKGHRWDLFAIVVVFASVSVAGAFWRARLHFYSINGVSYGATGDQAARAGFKPVRVSAGGTAGSLRSVGVACILNDRVVNLVGDHLERDGVTVVSSGARPRDVEAALGPPDDVWREGGESDLYSYVYRHHDVEVFFHEERVDSIEVGHRVTWPSGP